MPDQPSPNWPATRACALSRVRALSARVRCLTVSFRVKRSKGPPSLYSDGALYAGKGAVLFLTADGMKNCDVFAIASATYSFCSYPNGIHGSLN